MGLPASRVKPTVEDFVAFEAEEGAGGIAASATTSTGNGA